jgi:hypothetical protein
MQQALLYEDYHDALRCGDSGRLERSSDMLCVMFQGLTKLKNYRHLSLDFKASRAKEWTEEMRELWLLNRVVNLTGKDGKFLAIDEFDEWIVRAVEDVYNASGTIQSSNFTLNVVSPNVSRKVLESSGAPTYGYKHARVISLKNTAHLRTELHNPRIGARCSCVERTGTTEISGWSSLHCGHRSPTDPTSGLLELDNDHIPTSGKVAYAATTIYGTDVFCVMIREISKREGILLHSGEGNDDRRRLAIDSEYRPLLRRCRRDSGWRCFGAVCSEKRENWEGLMTKVQQLQTMWTRPVKSRKGFFLVANQGGHLMRS